MVPCPLFFTGVSFALVGGAYIIMAAYIVRSLPASVRAGVATLQQIDPSIEEASNSLGADAQYTFRKVTLPLITPALLAGLIFSFTRHITNLSAIIFLVSAKWRIVTVSILSEREQGVVETVNQSHLSIHALGKALKLEHLRPDLRAGDKVTIIVRPEAVKVQPANGIYEDVIKRAVYLGNLIEYDMDVSGQRITRVETDPMKMELIPVGNKVVVNFIEGCVQVLPAEGADA